jgi:hypothetical protein
MLTSALISPCGRAVLASPDDDDPLVYSKAEDQLRCERSLRPSHVVEGGDTASQVKMQLRSEEPRNEELIESLIREGQARDLGRRPCFLSQLNKEISVGGALVTLDLLNKGKVIRTDPKKPAGNKRPLSSMAAQEEVTVEKSTRFTGCFIVRGQFQTTRDQERAQELRDCEHYLKQDLRFQEVTSRMEVLGPGPERNEVLERFWGSAYSKYPPNQREQFRSRGKVLAEYIGLLDEERLRRSLCERSPGPSHVEDGGGDAQRSANRVHRSSAVTDGPSSLGSSVVGSESVSGPGLTGTCVASGHPLQT